MSFSASMPMAAASDTAEADSRKAETAVNEAPAMAMGAVVEEEAEAVYEASEEPMPVPAATSMPTDEPAADPTETEAADEPETAETEQPGLMEQAGEFFTDMGDFLLAALPYLAVLAVPAAAALIIRKRKK